MSTKPDEPQVFRNPGLPVGVAQQIADALGHRRQNWSMSSASTPSLPPTMASRKPSAWVST